MKKISMFLLAISIAAASFAQCATMDITTVKKINTGGPVTNLKIYNNVEVVLTADSSASLQVIGEKAAVETISVNFRDGNLLISSNAAETCNDRVTVYVPAAWISSVYIHGASGLSSLGVLENQRLDITINGTGISTVEAAGSISINTIADAMPASPVI